MWSPLVIVALHVGGVIAGAIGMRPASGGGLRVLRGAAEAVSAVRFRRRRAGRVKSGSVPK
ncbi:MULTISPECIES: hypothetical protein [unclassified Pseudarthrobacter]|uniref:hypothetical protein n=1 Tax=unclassified Pseudarthrobacter TaxID=2647000 RepID=UPI003076B5C2